MAARKSAFYTLITMSVLLQPADNYSWLKRPEPLPDNMYESYQVTNKDGMENLNINPTRPVSPWPKGEDSIFEAWDCSEPSNIERLSYQHETICQDKGPIRRIANATFTMLQETKRVRVDAFRCQLRETRQVTQCGMFDHIASINYLTYFEKDMVMPESICKQIVENGTFTTYKGNQVKVNKIGRSIINYEWIGSTWTNGGELECQGGEATIDGKYIYDAIIHVINTIEVTEVELVWEADLLEVPVQHVTLPCHIEDRLCETVEGTYI